MTQLTADPSSLWNVLTKTAQPGDEVLLEAGNYGYLSIYQSGHDAPGVLIRPEDGAVVTFAGINFDTSPGYTVRDCDITPSDHNNTCVIFKYADRCRIEACDVHGVVDAQPPDQRSSISLRYSKDVAIVCCDIHHLSTGPSHGDCDGVEITGNDIHDIQFDGVRGGPSNNVLVEGNRIHDMFPLAGDHPDGIQFWTTGATAPVVGITVRDNDLRMGAGGAYQGIFIKDEDWAGMSDITVTGNLVMAGMWTGIGVFGVADSPAAGVLIDDNFNQGFVGTLAPDGQGMTPRIVIDQTADAKVTNNFSTAWIVDPLDPSNETIPMAEPGDYSMADAWLATRFPPDPEPPETDLESRVAALEAWAGSFRPPT